MKVLVKLGGALLEDAELQSHIAEQLARAAGVHQIVVVHGGGKQVTRFLEERGVRSRFVNGLRVSDENVIDAVTKVIAGSVNKHLVSALTAAGVSAVGLSGLDGGLTRAAQLNPELGFVGTPSATDGRLFELLLAAGYMPVIACVGGDARGNIYNVNADQMAVSCAAGWNANRLIFLTDVPGVKGEDGAVIAQLATGDINRLIASGVVSGGMQAKLEAGRLAVQHGVDEVIVASGQERDICTRLFSGAELGTRLTGEAFAA